MRQTWIGPQSGDDRLARHIEPAANRPGTGRVLCIVVARQGEHVGEVDRVAVGIDQHAGAVGNAVGDRPIERHRNAGDAGTRRHLALDGARRLVLGADHGAIAGALPGKDVLLGGHVARNIAMAIDMVRRDVEPHRDVGVEGLQQLELVGGELQHVEAALAERREIERTAADIAADFAARTGLLEDVADQRRRRRLAVGACDGDELRLWLRPGQQFDIADDRLAGGARHDRDGMRRRQRAGNARADHERRDSRPIDRHRIGDPGSGLCRRVTRRGTVVPGDTIDSGCTEGAHGRQAGAREPQHDERRTLEDGEIDHPFTGASGSPGRPSPEWRR